jgi:hypothetical protein
MCPLVLFLKENSIESEPHEKNLEFVSQLEIVEQDSDTSLRWRVNTIMLMKKEVHFEMKQELLKSTLGDVQRVSNGKFPHLNKTRLSQTITQHKDTFSKKCNSFQH